MLNKTDTEMYDRWKRDVDEAFEALGDFIERCI
jgi:hypothetical protein